MINTRVYTVPKENSVRSVGGVTTANSSTTIKLDTQLNDTSQNGVQNKVIYAAIIELLKEITNSDNTLTLLRNGQTVTINSNTWKFDSTTGNLYYNGVVNVSSIFANAGNISNLTSTTGNITNLSGNELDYTTGTIDSLSGDDLSFTDATLETLTVTKSAHFFELIIDQIKSTQGQIIITPANAKFDKVDSTPSSYYRCYWKNEDGDKQIGNVFEVNDQVVCQTFNVTTGTSYDASNKYYWALVINTGSTEIDGEQYHYIDISKTDKHNASNGVPEVGDEVAQLGNRNRTDRQAAIIISAYNSQFLDSEIVAPSIVQYSGINNFTLATHRTNVISKGFNQFKGKFSTESGSDIEQMIEDIGEGTTMYIHTAYANSADGQTGFSKTYFAGATYMGMCSNFSSTDTDLVYSNYTWMRIKGETGDAGFSYNLLPVQEKAVVTKSDILGIALNYQLVKVEGTTVTPVAPSTSDFYMRFKTDNSQTTYNLQRQTTAFYYNVGTFLSNYHNATSKPTYLKVELLQNTDVVESRVINVTFDAGASLTIADEINASVQSVDGELNTYKQTANASISSLTNRMGTAESNITQTQTAIQTEVAARINGDIKLFPVNKPFYDYDGNIVTDYIDNPIRYEGGADIYSTPTYVEAGKYKLKFYSSISSLSALTQYFQVCWFGKRYPNSIGDDYSTYNVDISATSVNFKCKDGTTLYQYTADIELLSTDAGYYCINFWAQNEYINIADDVNEFETNYSRITQTNNRITTQVANINGQISTINQKADSIELAVNDTNLRLDNGQFTINADTEINGALTVTSADRGFILNSSGGNTYIVGDSIGSYYNFKNKQFITNTYQTAAIVNATSDSPQFTFTVNLGSLPLNTAVDFMQMRASFKGSTGTITYNSYNYTIALYKGTTPVKSMNGTNTELPSDVRYTTNSVASSYTAQITLTPQLNISEFPTTVEASFYFQLKIYTQTFNIIGTDGLASNFGTNKTFYVGNEGTYIRYNDDNVLKVSTAGIQKYAGDTYGRAQQKGYLPDTCISRYLSEYSPINGCAIRMVTSLNGNTSQCYLQPNDEMIVFNLGSTDNGKRLNIFLGSPSGKIGRIVYLKKTSSYGSLYVFGTDNSTSDTSANYTIKTADNGTTYWRDYINDASLMYISDGTFWNEYYCG